MNPVLKWAGGIILGLVVVIAIAAIGTVLVANQRADQQYEVEPVTVSIPTDAASIAEGQRQAAFRACTECHGPDLAGGLFIEDPMFGTLYVSNITSGGTTADFTVEDWDLAVRHGIGPDGKPLFIMPSSDYAAMSDEDLGRIIAYIQSVPAVDVVQPESRLGPMAYALVAAGQIPFEAAVIDHSVRAPVSVEPAVSAEYGRYLAQTCTGCHGRDWAGGPVPGSGPGDPPAANLTPAGHLATWTQEDFINTMRTGTTPEGHVLNPEQMPWPITQVMTDDELAALWLHFSSLPPTPTGS